VIGGILPSDVTLERFCDSRITYKVVRENTMPRRSAVLTDTYDRETDRLLAFIRGQQAAQIINQKREAA
jgi:hypothetical protein